MRTFNIHKRKPITTMSQGYVVERWTGKAWYASMCSPYKTMAEVNKHLKDYWWHYTTKNPYRIKDYKPPKLKLKPHIPKPNFRKMIEDDDYGMVYSYGK